MATESREYRIAVKTRLQEREQNPQNGIKTAPNAKSHPSFVSAGKRKGTPAPMRWNVQSLLKMLGYESRLDE